MEQKQATIQPERFLSRLDRRAPAAAHQLVAEPAALTLFLDLQERIVADLGERASGLAPLLDELKQHVAALFPTDPRLALAEDEHGERKTKVEALCATLEDVLYAMSLSLR